MKKNLSRLLIELLNILMTFLFRAAWIRFDRMLREFTENLITERHASEVIFRNYHELMHHIWYGLEHDESNDNGIIGHQGAIFERLSVFHKQLDESFKEMMSSLEEQIKRLEFVSAEKDNPQDFLYWIQRLKAHAQHISAGFNSITVPERYLL